MPIFFNDLKELAKLRIEEAELLNNHGKHSGAYYLAGYSMECAIKACIAKQTRPAEFPDKRKGEKCFTHNLKELVGLALLENSLKAEKKNNASFKGYWTTITDWTEQHRYETIRKNMADDMIQAITDPAKGAMQWIQRHW